MNQLARRDFSGGWQPSADAVNAPATALLRADNLVLDERGVLGLRRGSAKINGVAFADLDVHSLFTVNLSGTRYRMAGANNAVYANGASVSTGFAGSGDIAFGSYLDQILMARSTTKRKYDGTTVRTWGIAAPSAAPTLTTLAADSDTFASFNSGESGLAWTEDDGTGTGHAAGFDGTANGAVVLNPNATTGRGRITRDLGGATDFATYSGGQTGTDDDQIQLYMYVTEPEYLINLVLWFDVGDGSFQRDVYSYIFFFNGSVEEGTNTPLSVGWNLLSVRRGDLLRWANPTAGTNWSTVRAVRLTVNQQVGSTSAQVRFDQWRIIGGNQRPLTGVQRYRLVAVRNTGTYFGKSAPSAVSADIETTAQGVRATVAAGVIAALDTQVNELWLYRENDALGDYYRVAVLTGGPWAGAQTIDDITSNDAALEANLLLEATNTTPPDNIIAIVGPHYDRVLCLTATHVYPSQPRNLDSFDSEQVIRVGDASETAYWIAKVREELYVGTSKDIYRLVGDWSQRADGTVNVTKIPMGIGAPPIASAIAQDGDTLIYLASDGWRQLGSEVPVTSGAVDLLYRGYTRHGVSPVNLSTGRFKAALTKGWFQAITPEGASTTSSTVLHRYVPALRQWYRHTYTPNWRCIYREPDGTLIASDTAGFVWTLDTGTQDEGANIPVVLWTPVDDNGQPNNRKDGWEARVRANTGGATATVGVHLDGSGSTATTFAVAGSDLTPVAAALDGIAAFRQIQLRVTGSFSTFLWYDFTVTYRERPPIVVYAEPKPEARGTRRKRYTGLRITIDTLAGPATVIPVVDDLDQPSHTINTSDVLSRAMTFQNVVGRDLWAKISKPTGFEFYAIDPIVVSEMPPIQQGLFPDTNGGYPFRKRIIGLRLRVCTLGATIQFTPVVDGVSLTAFTAQTGTNEPDEILHYFTTQQIATDVAFGTNGDIELYEFEPIVQQKFPQPVRLRIPDTNAGTPGPKQITGLRIRACTLGSTRTFIPILDGVNQTAFTATTDANEPDEIVHSFSSPQLATDVAFTVDGNVELYDWAPLVDATLPLGRTLWDSGPIDLGTRAVWLRLVTFKAKLTGTLTVTPYVDDVAQTPITVSARSGHPITTYDAVLARTVRGRQVRFVFSASSAFYLYWLEPRYRVTGHETELAKTRVEVAA